MKFKKYYCVILLLVLAIIFSSCNSSITSYSSVSNTISSENSSSTGISFGEGIYEPYATGWHANKSVGAGFSTRYLFNSEGSFYYAASEMDSTDPLRYMEGLWSYENNTIKLVVQRKIVLEDGTYSKVVLDKNDYEYRTLIISALSDEDVDFGDGKRKTILIDNVQFWDVGLGNCSDIPDLWNDYS